MAYRTVESIVKAAIRKSYKIYNEAALTDDMIQQGVDFYNASEPFVWRKMPWHNRKINEFSETPDADGIILFDGDNVDVDVVQAVKAIDSDGDIAALIWNETEIRAAMDGVEVNSDKFQHLSDDASGNRRIRVNEDNSISTYKILALRRFVKALGPLETGYDADDSSANDNDYRTLTWKIDRAEAPLVAYIANSFDQWRGKEGTGEWIHGLNGTVKDLEEQEANNPTLTPESGMFGEIGAWD